MPLPPRPPLLELPLLCWLPDSGRGPIRTREPLPIWRVAVRGQELDPVALAQLPAAVVAELELGPIRVGRSTALVAAAEFGQPALGRGHQLAVLLQLRLGGPQLVTGGLQSQLAIGESASHAPTVPRLCRIEQGGEVGRGAHLRALTGMRAGVLQPRLQGAPPLAHQHLGPALGRGGFPIGQLGQELLLEAQHRPAPAGAQIGFVLLLATAAPGCWFAGHGRLDPCSTVRPSIRAGQQKARPRATGGRRAGDAGQGGLRLGGADQRRGRRPEVRLIVFAGGRGVVQLPWVA